MSLVIAYDPGFITGVAVGEFTPDEPVRVTATSTRTYDEMRRRLAHQKSYPYRAVVIEEFILRDNDFAADLHGVRVEGMLELAYEDSDTDLVWRPPSKKSQVPDQVLKDHDLWQTGKDVDWEDGRDANDAIIHLLGYVAFDLKHVPTLRKYFR